MLKNTKPTQAEVSKQISDATNDLKASFTLDIDYANNWKTAEELQAKKASDKERRKKIYKNIQWKMLI